MTSSGTRRPIAPLEYTATSTLPCRSRTKPVACKYAAFSPTKAPVSAAMLAASAPKPTGNANAQPGNELGRCLFVVDRQRNDLGTGGNEAIVGPRERRELSAAVRTPRPAIEENHSVGPFEITRDCERLAADDLDSEVREHLSVAEERTIWSWYHDAIGARFARARYAT